MIKRIYTTTIILAIIAASFFYASGVRQPAFVGAAQAAPTSLSSYAGIAAYTKIELDNLEAVKSAFLMVEYQTNDLLVGTLDLPGYESIYDPLVLVTINGDIVAFYPNSDPASKMIDVISRNLDETLLEKAVKTVATAAGVVPTSISHYDFGNPAAEKILLVAEYEPDGNAFTLQFGTGNTYNEKSYAFYRTYAPSFSLDNDFIDQVDFVEANADYIGAGYYGTIYGHFTGVDSNIDFDPEVLNTFAVEAGDHFGFGALAILFNGEGFYTVNDKDFDEVIDLGLPGIEQVFDLTPGDFSKTSVTGLSLEPTLSWDESTAPNYEYCIDTIDNSECDTSWISTGSSTSAALSNLKYETTYYWQVRAVNSYDVIEANGGAWWSFTTADGIAPKAFTKESTALREPIDSLSKVTMTWTPSYGAYYYEVCVDTSAACIAPELWHNVGLATTATIGDLLLDSTYYWQVRAWNGFDDLGAENVGYYTYAGAESQWEVFTTRRFSKLSPVQDEVYNITLPFKWEETPIAENNYEYCIINEFQSIVNCDWKKVTGTSVVVRKLPAGTYYWQVRTLDDAVEANNGEWWEFDVLAKKEVSKINLFKVSPVDGAVQSLPDLGLSWKTTKTAISYEYCFFAVDDTDTTPISDNDSCTYPGEGEEPWIPVGTNTSTTLSGLSYATTYYWQVRANIGSPIEPDWLYADKGDYWTFTTQIAP